MELNKMLEECTLCIRNCKVNRLNNKLGFCKATNVIKVARAKLHFWEEPAISGKNGSGTVFFSNCNLRCVFCQNHIISSEGFGKEISINRLSEIFLELQNQGAHNINLVTPTHYVPQIIKALDIAKKNGLTIPIVYNTNGYDSLETIKSLNGYIDVYLPDFKYFNNKFAIKYSNANNYSNNILNILNEMFSQVGSVQFNSLGIIKKGIIIRHLMLPGLLFDSKKIIDSIYKTFGDDVYISIMNQYTPTYKAKEYSEINKPLNNKHYICLINYALNIGVINGFIQDSGTNCESFIPEFNNDGV
ncbi:radical SAM protein [Clostridium tarantellae]|uniref:Radical SAM protein n=1 Tax=Clostridium tarantellae TaxID=39493 RepID=A0A6I1MUW3_9CLOT|nr:radical SAM protein [Clostridium tarantellae]MPQ43999.1 radical SAM protein [Clostridium tarantellae]